MLRAITLASIVLLAGCGSKKDKDKPTDQPAAGSAPAKPAKKPALELFTGTKLTLPEPIARLRIGMPADEATKLVPGGKLDSIEHVEGWEAVDTMVSTTSDKKAVRVIQVFLKKTPFADSRARLDKIWGPGKENPSEKGHYVWMDPAGGWRMEAREPGGGGTDLVFEPMQAFDTLLGPDGKFDFEAKGTLLGASEADVMALPGAIKRDDTRIDLPHPANDASSHGPDVIVKMDAGKVKEWQIQLLTELDPGGQQKLLDRLKARFGEPKPRDTIYWEYKGKDEKATLDVSHLKDGYDSFGVTLWVKPAK